MSRWQQPLFWKYTAREMQRRPGRTLLTLLGIVIGVAAAVAISLTIRATRRAHHDMFQALAGRASLEVVDAGLGKFRLDDVEKLAGLASVKAGVPVIQTPAVLVAGKGAVPVLVLGIDPAKDGVARDYPLRRGRPLHGPDAMLLEAGFAAANDLGLGDQARLLTFSDSATLPIVGLLEPRGAATFNGGAVVVMPLTTARRLFDFGAREINSYQLVLAEDAVQDTVKEEVRRRLRPGLTVQEPASRGTLARDSMLSSEQGLATLSVSSLVAGAFVILNAFLMNLGERRRQLAILRALGATRAQVTRLLLREALVLGIAGTLVGIAAGFLLAAALSQMMARVMAVTLPEVGWTLEPFLIAFLLGPGMALLAAYLPARRAGRRAPLPDLLHTRGIRSEPVRRWPGYVGLMLLVLALLLALGAVGGIIPAALAVAFLPPTMGLFLVGCVLAVPLILPGLMRLAGWLLRPLLGMEGHLAVRQLQRHEGRTALTVGVLLVAVIFAIGFGQTLVNNIRGIHQWLDHVAEGDFLIRKTWPDLSTVVTTAALPDNLDEVNDPRLVQHMDKLSWVRARAGGREVSVIAYTYRAGRRPPLDLVRGHPDEVLRGLLRGEVVLGTALGQRLGLGPGDDVSVETRHGPRSLRIAGTATEYTGGGMALYMQHDDATRLFDLKGVHTFVITARPGKADELAPRLQAFCDRHHYLLQSSAEFRGMFDRQTSGFLGFVWALTALVFVVASLGIVNTLTMNVLEQTRELGTLRAVGMKRSQVRKLVLAQALILGVISLLPGVAGGIALAYLMNLTIYPLLGQTIPFRLDPWLVGSCFAVALAIALLAAYFPARRAARLQVIQALQYE